MKFQMNHDDHTYNVFLDTEHPAMGRMLLMYPESVLKDLLANSFRDLGLSPETVEDINKGGTWCVVTLAN